MVKTTLPVISRGSFSKMHLVPSFHPAEPRGAERAEKRNRTLAAAAARAAAARAALGEQSGGTLVYHSFRSCTGRWLRAGVALRDGDGDHVVVLHKLLGRTDLLPWHLPEQAVSAVLPL